MANFTRKELNTIIDAINAYENCVDNQKQTEEMKEQIQEIHDFVRRKEEEIRKANANSVRRIMEKRKTNPNYARSKKGAQNGKTKS